MTGYKSKRAAAQDKLKLWDTPSEEFNDWWGNGYCSDTNPFSIDSLVYWAWAGWQAALAQLEREPVGFVDSKLNPIQRPWVDLTDESVTQVIDLMPNGINGWMSDWDLYEFARAVLAKSKEKNS